MNIASLTSSYCANVDEELSTVAVVDEIKDEMQEVLNSGPYYQRTSGQCPRDRQMIDCDFTNIGLTANAKAMIQKTKWYLGGSPNYDQTASSFYRFERGTSVSSSEHPSYWIGDVGLIYPSDFGYAGGSNSCLSSVLNSKLCISWVALNSWTITQRTAYSYVFIYLEQGI